MYRSQYPQNNFSFTPNFTNELGTEATSYPSNNYNTSFAPMFPKIPESYKTPIEDPGYFDKKEKEEYIISNISIKLSNLPTRHSTESNESIENVANRKYYTPTHQNTNLNKQYNINSFHRELDFSTNVINNKFNITNNANTITPNNGLFSPNHFNLSNSTYQYPQTPTNNAKSLSFCTNNIKSPTMIKYNSTEYKQKGFNNQNMNDHKYQVSNKEEVLDFKVNLENLIIGKDKRTTLMLRNIPNKYTLQNLVDEIMNSSPSFAGKFDYINLPIDYEV